MSDRNGKWYYYANERGCLRHPDALDELGIGFDDKKTSCSLTIRLMELRKDLPHRRQFTMVLCAHNDEWQSFDLCADVFRMLSKNGIPSGMMEAEAPFYDLRAKIENLGYKNLGRLRD